MIKLPKPNLILLLVLAVALSVRLWGINHGLPFLYHPDEPQLVRSAYGLRFGNLNPGHFDWPHFHLYLCFVIFEAFIKVRVLLQVLRLRPLLESLAPLLWQDPAIFYFLARLVSALMGTATVGLTYLIGKKLFDKKVGLVAALFLALSSLHVDQSHYALLDVPLAFWVLLSFYFSILILEKGRLRDYLLAGLFAGFAASTKYNGALIVIPIVAAHFLRIGPTVPRSERSSATGVGHIRSILLAGLAAVVGFLLGTPYALLDSKTFLFKEDARGFLWQFKNMQGHMGAEAANGWWFHFTETLRGGLGVVILGFAVLGIILALVQHRRRDVFLLSFPLLYFLYVGSWTVVYGRFMLPILPMLCLLAAYFVSTVVKRLLDSEFVLAIMVGLALIQPVGLVVRGDRVFSQKDTRTLAKEWIDANLPDKAHIAEDTIYGRQLDPFYLPNIRQTRGEEDAEKGFYRTPWDYLSDASPGREPQEFLADFKIAEIDYLITSSLVYSRFFSQRVEELHPDIKNTQADYLWFDANFEVLKMFEPTGRPGPVIKIYRVVYPVELD